MAIESSMLTTFTWLRKGVLNQGLNECSVVKCDGKVLSRGLNKCLETLTTSYYERHEGTNSTSSLKSAAFVS